METTSKMNPGIKRNVPNSGYGKEALGPKKTAFIIVTVIGCIAILWPKVFYPMMFGGSPAKQVNKEPRLGGCCDVVFDRHQYLNSTLEIGPQLHYHKMNLHDVGISIRQERPSHLHPESIYMAMRERGRAIPSTPSIPIVERRNSPSNPPPRIVDGRPGPIPGMRPPMGAGSFHHPQTKGNTMGFLMPLYTLCIMVFFGYTIMKLVFKKPVANAPYGNAPGDPAFRKDVFGNENGNHDENSSNPKLVVTAIQGLIDAADEELKLRENRSTDPDKNLIKSNDPHDTNETESSAINGISTEASQEANQNTDNSTSTEPRKIREGSSERTVSILGMEVTASREGGQKWVGRPPTPVFGTHNDNANINEPVPEPQAIYLEGSLAHESQILVSDAETKLEEALDMNGTPEEPAIVLSSKMTLSLINLDSNVENKNPANDDTESPLADDIEIIGDDRGI